MANNLTKRLEKLEKGIQAFIESKTPSGPIYLSEGETIPEGREAIIISMHWVDPVVEDDAQLEDGQSEVAQRAPRKTPSTLPPSSETPAEREERWKKHLLAIDARGERYDDGDSDPRRSNWRQGIV
jgi:hypothetical protein